MFATFRHTDIVCRRSSTRCPSVVVTPATPPQISLREKRRSSRPVFGPRAYPNYISEYSL